MAEILKEFLDTIKKEDLHVNFVQVRQNGEIIADWMRMNAKTRLNTWSASKSFVAIAIGVACDEGLLTLDEKICGSFAEYLPENPSKNLTELTVTHLLTMTTGLANPLFFANDRERYETSDWISHFFNAKFSRKPGEHYMYSNFNTYILGCLIEKKSGQNLLEFMRHRIFEPLDILSPDWTFDPMGHVHAANGLYVTIDEMANFGEMVLGGGVFRGKRIVSKAFIDDATSLHSIGRPGSEGEWGYGYQFWLNPDRKSFSAVGRYGQYIVIIPEKNAVIAVQSLECKDVFPAVWEYIALKLQ